MILHLKFTGVILLVFAVIHVAFPRYFNWRNELSSLSLINRQMIQVHTFFIALILLLMGLMCFIYGEELVKPGLGSGIAMGLAIFWLARLIVQLFGYSSRLWKGKLFETTIHVLFTLIWTYFAIIFFLIHFRIGYRPV